MKELELLVHKNKNNNLKFNKISQIIKTFIKNSNNNYYYKIVKQRSLLMSKEKKLKY
jgi:hypothetical protein